MTKRIILLIALVLLPSVAIGQTRENPRVWLRTSHETSSLVRLTVSTPSTLQGIISSISDSTLVINQAKVYVDSVTVIEIGERSGARGTVVGALIGGILGFGLMGLASSDSPCSTCWMGAIALTGAGAVIGSAASRHTAWKVVWERH
jgi:hypothetical protein